MSDARTVCIEIMSMTVDHLDEPRMKVIHKTAQRGAGRAVQDPVPMGTVIERAQTAYLAGKAAAGRAVQDGLDRPTSENWRYVLWLHHGHDGLYGDDGEMQCNRYPPVDFKRQHIDALIWHIGWSPISAAPPPHDPVGSEQPE